MDRYEAYPRPAQRRAPKRNKFGARQFGDFDCCHCGRPVSADPWLSGVNHRNHCPYCLWSRHVDLYAPGDRLCACQGRMRPVGLAFKHVHKKYASAQPGELMLVHRCQDCSAVLLNRVAADDSPASLWDVYQESLAQPLAVPGVELLGCEAAGWLRARL